MIFIEITLGEDQIICHEVNKVMLNEVIVDGIINGHKYEPIRAGLLLAEFLTRCETFISISLKDKESPIIINKNKISKARVWETDY